MAKLKKRRKSKDDQRRDQFVKRMTKARKAKGKHPAGMRIHLTSADRVRQFLSKIVNMTLRGEIDDKIARACTYGCQTLLSYFKYKRETDLEDRIGQVEELLKELKKNETGSQVATEKVRKIFAVPTKKRPTQVSVDADGSAGVGAVDSGQAGNTTQAESAEPIDEPTYRTRQTKNGNTIRIAR